MNRGRVRLFVQKIQVVYNHPLPLVLKFSNLVQNDLCKVLLPPDKKAKFEASIQLENVLYNPFEEKGWKMFDL